LSSHDDDPAAPATAKLGQAVAVLAGTAEAFAQLAGVTCCHPSPRGCPGPTARRCVRRAAVTTSAGRRPCRARSWARAAARCWPDDPEAQAARRAAEERLGELRPEAMRVYGGQVAAGVDPVTAMRDAGWLLDREPGQVRPRTCCRPFSARRGRPGRRRPRTTPDRGGRPAPDRGRNRRGLTGGAFGLTALPRPAGG